VTDRSSSPVVCDMTHAADTPAERRAEYHDLFTRALVDRERIATGIRFRFGADPGVGEQVRDLAAKEQACCAFFNFTIGEQVDEVWWDASVIDDPVARQILDEFYEFPARLSEDTENLHARFSEAGLDFVVDDQGVRRLATPGEFGLKG
jgi:hypothetical protein